MATYLRSRNATVAVGIESTVGTDIFAGSPNVSTDFLRAEVTVNFRQNSIDNPENTGSLDRSPPIAGGTRGEITLRCVLRGSGTPETPPRFGKMLRVCTWDEAVTAAAIGAPTAASAGSATTVTAASPFGTTAQAYRGMPISLAVNPSGGAGDVIQNYTAGRVITLGAKSYSPVLDNTTTLQIPKNVLYRPISDENSFKTATVYVYQDGLRHEFVGCAGRWTLELTAAGIGFITFVLQGVYVESEAAVTPSNIVYDEATPPIWRDGISRVNRSLVRVSRMTFDSGVSLIEPENPEAVEGYDPAVVAERAVNGSLDPLMSVTETVARITAFRQGTPQIVAAQLGEVAGNRFWIMVPSARYTGYSPTNRQGLLAESINFAAEGADASVFIAQY